MVSGIYKITCLANGKIYIGQSIMLGERKRQHWDKLRLGKHNNENMQADWNTFGAANFRFEVLEKCPEINLNEREVYWIAQYNATNPEVGYNQQMGGAHANKGQKVKPKYSATAKYKRS